MKNTLVDKIVDQAFTEKALHTFYCTTNTCAGWERNVVDQPEAVKKIIDSGADRIAAGLGYGNKISELGMARMIDHTLLKADATVNDIKKLCGEARQYHFASVCINPGFVPLCRDELRGTDTKVCTVIGFPLGATSTEAKRAEAKQALNSGAQEIDMVINIGRLKSEDYDYVFNDINQVVLAAKAKNSVCKVIIETSLLSDEEKVKACVLAKKAKADFVKTSTGFSTGGATASDVALMKYVVGSGVGVKASGGIHSQAEAQDMIASGADRIGASASIKIVTGDTTSGNGKY